MVRLSLLALLVGLAPAASAQMAVEAAGAAGTLSPGAEPAQVSFDVRAVADVGEYVSDAECVGTVDPSAPDVVVEWGGGDLRVWVRAPFDATLAVARPDGRWACNDDFEGLSPVVELADAPAGRYAVWLGSFSPDPFETSATLYAGTPPPPPVLDAGAAPLAGTITAAGGFEATQGAIEVAVSAGNADRVDAIDLSGTPDPPGFCGGTIDAGQPSAAIAYTADGGTGTLAIGAMDLETDLVLVVQAPDGRVYCNDDFVDRNPLVAVTDPPSGTYVVWVGTFAGGASAGAPTLTIAETAPENDFGDFDFDGDFGPTPFTEGTYTVLDIGAVPSVRMVATAAEGASQQVTVQPVAANPVQGGSCSGYVETIATAAVTLSGDGPFALTASAADDLTLTVRTPTGRWFCSDDADGLDPGVQIDDAEAGDYLVWVGTFGELGGTTSATLAAEPGEIVVSGGFYGPEPFDGVTQSEGTYDGDEIRPNLAALAVEVGEDGVSETVRAGGPVLNPVQGEACHGFLSALPTATVSSTEPVEVSADSDDHDLTLVVRAPDGSWTCSDDAEGRNPRAVVDGGAGTYSVWIGTYSRRTEPVQVQMSVVPAPLEEFMVPPPPAPPIRG